MTAQEFFTNIQNRFKDMSMGQRVGVIGLGTFAVAVIVVSIMWAGAPDYQYLFTDLTESDASLVVQKLKEDRIPYKLTKGGSAIQIPEDRVYETRLALASEGLPKGSTGDGFSLFDETKFSTSEFVQKINYQRALQNELARTIMSIEEVDYARVHITLPKESVFIEDEQPAKASVVIRPQAGRTINPSQVQGIVFLTARSVRGLEPDHISIVDIRGRVLYEGRDDQDAAAFASNHLEMKNAVEHSLQKRAQDMLETIVGPGSAVVKISADVNMDMVKNVIDSYDPEGQVVRSENLRRDYRGAPATPGGVAGTQSNLPTGRGGPGALPDYGLQGGPGAAGNGSSDVARNYEISRTQTERIISPGDVTRLTISVVVDGTYQTAEDGQRTFVPRSEEELTNIGTAVRHAVGFSADREDTIAVSCMPFAQNDSEIDAYAQKEQKRELIDAALKYLVPLVIVLLVLLFVVRPLMKYLSGSLTVTEQTTNQTLELAADGETPEALEGPDMTAPQVEAVAKSEIMKQAVRGHREQIHGIAQEDVGSAISVIKVWLKENA